MVARLLLRLADVGCSGAASLELSLMSAAALLGGVTEPVSESSAEALKPSLPALRKDSWIVVLLRLLLLRSAMTGNGGHSRPS